MPCFFESDTCEAALNWIGAMNEAERRYFAMLKCGCMPREARSVLPNSIKTEVVMTANYREWRHFFWLRAARKTGPAHPQMEELTVPLLREIIDKIPVVFDDIAEECAKYYSERFYGVFDKMPAK